MNTARALPVGDVYDGVETALETKRITYEAADGLKIPAYLTLPAGKPASKLPLIVLPHGGPAYRDTADFDWWTQALAAQGYAVLRPNFRGSTTTQSFMTAGYGQWGRKMQTDLSDGVRYLAKQGTIDPARVCIVGASYGGYAALAGVSLDPGVYRCAVSVAGISDLKQMLKWEKQRESGGDHVGTRFWNRFMGVTGPDDPSLDAISPIKHLDRVNVPVLLIHGKDDTVVAYEQSEIMLKALKKANKPVELVTLKKEDHWLSRGETRLQMLKSSMAFIEANNPPD
jgi:dipeptidyl aminopeptidase/acylaminoacyl peptidase